MTREHHKTYSNLVENEGDFVGKIAYSLYKEEKMRWYADLKSRGENPTKEDALNFFILPANQPESLAKYREDAEQLLQDYFEISFADMLAEFESSIEKTAIVERVIDGKDAVINKIDDKHDALVSKVELEIGGLKKPFWHSVGENLTIGIVSAGAMLLLTLLCAMAVASFHEELKDFLTWVGL